MSKEQKVMFNRIFVGTKTVNPSIVYIQRRFKGFDVESIGLDLWMKLITSGKEFNWTYFRMKLMDLCRKAYNKEVTRLKRETKGLNTGEIATDLNQEQYKAAEPPEIVWKEPLTAPEQQMVQCLMQEMSQRDIYKKFKIHPSKQGELRKAIKEKMEVI